MTKTRRPDIAAIKGVSNAAWKRPFLVDPDHMNARNTLMARLKRRRDNIYDFVFPSRIDYLGHLSTRRYARLVDDALTLSQRTEI